MGIFSQFGIFDLDDVDLRSDIHNDGTPGPLTKLFRGVNALREHILDTTPVGSAVREFRGHDHADSGPPLSRACIYCEDNGNLPCWIVTPPAAQAYVRIDSTLNGNGLAPFQRTDKALATGYASPKCNTVALLSGQTWYTATGGSFQLKLIELFSNQEVIVDLPEHAGPQQALVEFEKGFAPGEWNEWWVYAQCDKYDGANPPTLNIHSLSLHETVWLTTPKLEEPI